MHIDRVQDNAEYLQSFYLPFWLWLLLIMHKIQKFEIQAFSKFALIDGYNNIILFCSEKYTLPTKKILPSSFRC